MKTLRLLLTVAMLTASCGAFAAQMQVPAAPNAIFKRVVTKKVAAQTTADQLAQAIAQKKDWTAKEFDSECVKFVLANTNFFSKYAKLTDVPDNLKEHAVFKALAHALNENSRILIPAILDQYITEAKAKIATPLADAQIEKLKANLQKLYITEQPVDKVLWNYMFLMHRTMQKNFTNKQNAKEDVIALAAQAAAGTVKYAQRKFESAMTTSWGSTIARTAAAGVLYLHKDKALTIPGTGVKSPALINKLALLGVLAYNAHVSATTKTGYINRFLHAWKNAVHTTTDIDGAPDYAALLS